LPDPHQCESTFDVGQVTTTNHEDRWLPNFAKASHNVATMIALFDTLPAPSTDGMGEV
jgi:hypothetical protein